MTKFSPRATERQTPEPLPRSSPAFLVFIFRLLLLVVGGGLAGLLGIIIAQFYPARPQGPPFLERVLRHSSELIQSMRQLPERWEQSESRDGISPAIAPPGNSLETTEPSSVVLTDAQRQALRGELAQLITDLRSISDRTTALEAQVGTPQPGASLESRLATLDRQLTPGSSMGGGNPTNSMAPLAGDSAVSTVTTSLARANELMVTLPSDALFASDRATLRPETEALLDSIIGDLQRYPGATIQVSAHTDNQGTAAINRALSFNQAKAVEQYLSDALGQGFHWVVIGYGHTRPLATNSTPINRQRNRRIEVAIDPRP